MKMDCEYYERSKRVESCCFAFSCKEDCYFKLKGLDEVCEELERENEDLRTELSMIINCDDELEQLRQEYDEIEGEKNTLESSYTNLFNFIKEMIPRIEMNRDGLRDKLLSLDILYNDNIVLLNMIEEKESKKMNNDINIKIVADEEKYKPVYANETDYCMDLKVKINNKKPEQYDFYVHNETVLLMEDKNTSIIMPNQSKVFSTGIKVSLPEGWGMFILPRSSTGFKLNCQLANTVGMIDSGYRDNILVKLHNFGTEPVELKDGQRICQIFVLPKYNIKPEYVEDNEEFRLGDRKGGIGSTGV